MIVFCVLWVPFVYLLRRSIFGKGSSSGGVWALIFGVVTAAVQFFLGDFINPGGFGFSRVLFGFIDLICVPVLIPVFIYLIMLIFRRFSGEIDFCVFTLLWLIPAGCFRALGWSSGNYAASTLNDPILFIAVPVLWTALAVGVSFFISWIINSRYIIFKIAASLCILILPPAAALSYWAFFSQQTYLGYGLLILVNIPFILSLILRGR